MRSANAIGVFDSGVGGLSVLRHVRTQLPSVPLLYVADSGHVTGAINGLQALLDMLQSKRGSYDAVALATRITPHIDTVELHRNYFGKGGANPWGGVEAVLTHTTSTVLNCPTAHAPTSTRSWTTSSRSRISLSPAGSESVRTTCHNA